jgi:hypothetical protein
MRKVCKLCRDLQKDCPEWGLYIRIRNRRIYYIFQIPEKIGLQNVETIKKSSNEELVFEKSNKENRPIVVPNPQLNAKKFHGPQPTGTEKPKTMAMKFALHQKQKKSMVIPKVAPAMPTQRPKEPLRSSSSGNQVIDKKKIADVTSRMQNYAKIYAERKEMLIKKHSSNIIPKKAAPVEMKSQRLTIVQRPANGNNVKKETKVRTTTADHHDFVAKKSLSNIPIRLKTAQSSQVKVTDSKMTTGNRKEFYEKQKQQQIDKKRQVSY